MILRLYTRLLRLYPPAFYERFGAEMSHVFAEAWHHRPHGRLATLSFCLHEFGGLLVSVVTEYGRGGSHSGLRKLFRRQFIPFWLFGLSLMVGALISLGYWGYLTVPASTISGVKTIDQIALVRFDASNFTPAAIPLNRLPWLVTPEFPPSQILTGLPPLAIAKTLDPALAEQLAAALARERIDLGSARPEYPAEPVIHPDGCGSSCFQAGVQQQADGSLILSFPAMTSEGQPPIPAYRKKLTANEWEYYGYIMPAGYVVQGRDAEGAAVIFTAIASAALSSDHYRYDELTFTRQSDGLILRNRMSYNFDIAGLEGYHFPLITLSLFVPLLMLWLVLLIIGMVTGFVRRQTIRIRSIARS